MGWIIVVVVVTLIVAVPLISYTIHQSRKFGDKMFTKKNKT